MTQSLLTPWSPSSTRSTLLHSTSANSFSPWFQNTLCHATACSQFPLRRLPQVDLDSVQLSAAVHAMFKVLAPPLARCHKPPIPDPELIKLIKLFNAKQKAGDPNARWEWTCNPCVTPKAITPQPQIAAPPARPLGIKTVSQRLATAQSKPSGGSQSDAIVVDDDDDSDDIVILDKPPPPPAPANKKGKEPMLPSRSRNLSTLERNQPGTSISQASSSNLRDSKEIDRRPPVLASVPGHRTPAQSESDVEIIAVSSPAKALPQKVLAAKKTATVVRTRNDTDILIVDYPEPAVSNNEQQTPSVRDDPDDDGLEYLTPPQRAPAALPPVDPPRTPPEPLPSDQPAVPTNVVSVSALTTKLLLLPAWIDSRHTAPDAEPDLWERRRRILERGKRNDPTAGRGGKSSRGRKSKAHHLNSSGLGVTSSKSSFFFSADDWMRQKLQAS
ncbi:hypothetical protein CVT26_013988 [Gymnopilus dilepis]|uniref:Uncharacterized protein n=1 Tax=Gymnopilus dilepis TaxID=231916 RepID=A0A409VWC4_9AGAR|nr:hypothetical protein CVT26_013988 [Gymnopilus dilepis]